MYNLSLDLDEMNYENLEDAISQISIKKYLNKPIPSEILDNNGIYREQLKNYAMKHDY